MNSPFLCSLLSGVLLFFAYAANGFQPPAQKELPNFDRRIPQDSNAASAKREAARTQSPHLRGVKIDFDEILGTPKNISRSDGFLSGKNGKTFSTPTLAKFPTNDAHRVTKAFLEEHRALFGHGAEILDGAKIQREFVSRHNGMRTVIWEQRLGDLPIFDSLLIAHMSKDEELINLSSRFLPAPNQAARQNAITLSAAQAIVIAAQNLGEKISAQEIFPRDEALGAERKQKFQSAALPGLTEVRLVWLPMDAASLRLCWKIILKSQSRGATFRVLVDAQNGEILLRHNLTSHLSDASYRVFTSDSPSPFSPGHSVPSSTEPPVIARELVVTSAFNTNASPNGWINDGDNETRGNNVDAHLDLNADDAPDLPRPQGSPFRVFDFPLDLSQAPFAYRNAAVVQLFFLGNWYHDKLYEFGFTEAAGNFQADNFGRGGVGGDALQLDAQDGGGANNADFTSEGDGSGGRVQMFIFTGPNPDRDGDLDTEIVFHELTHGLSTRLVGGNGLTASQSMGMGEGWSDFYALALLAQNGDDVNGNYAFGAYITRQFSGLMENYYFGIRRYPYSTDLAKSPLTFKDIDPAQASGHFGSPRNPSAGLSGASEVHSQGEVWCSVLWEVRAALVIKHGFETGNPLTLQLVTDGMILSPPNPNFLQARDAILLADRVNNDGANYEELWAAFAKRGLGFFAQSPSASTTTGVIESFSAPDDLLISPASFFPASGKVGGPFNHASQTLTLTNGRTNFISWTAGATASWLDVTPTNGTLAPGQFTNVTVTLNANANFLPMGIYPETVRVLNLISGVEQTRTFLLAVAQPDYLTKFFAQGGFDLDHQTFTFTPDGSANFYSVCRGAATNFLTDPTGGTALSLSDDDFETVVLSSATPVRIYEHSRNVFYIGSNGYITLDGGDDTFDPSLKSHFDQPRVSALFADLLPAAGAVSWRQMSNRVAVTYANAREYNFANTNQFQIELFFDGRIRVTYLRIDAELGLAGLSRGAGVPNGLIESDFLAYQTCLGRPSITRGFFNEEGKFVLAFTTEAVGLYAVEVTEDFTGWTTLADSIPGTGGVVEWVDETNPQNPVARFYRVRGD